MRTSTIFAILALAVFQAQAKQDLSIGYHIARTAKPVKPVKYNLCFQCAGGVVPSALNGNGKTGIAGCRHQSGNLYICDDVQETVQEWCNLNKPTNGQVSFGELVQC